MPTSPPGDSAASGPPSEAALDGGAGLFHALYTTRALRRFRPDPIPEDVLFQILDAAIRAPTGQNAQDWRFIIVTDAAVKRRRARRRADPRARAWADPLVVDRQMAR